MLLKRIREIDMHRCRSESRVSLKDKISKEVQGDDSDTATDMRPSHVKVAAEAQQTKPIRSTDSETELLA